MYLKKVFIAVVFVFAALTSFAQMSKTELQDMYVEYLKQEGYSPSIYSDGDVIFKVEGRTFFISVDESDLEFFRVNYNLNYELENAKERRQFPIAVAYANSNTKVAKVISLENGGRVNISAQVLLNRPEDFKYIFSRLLSTLRTAREIFVEKMQE
jgi:hypothetical protein